MSYPLSDFDIISAYYQGITDTIELYAIYRSGNRTIGVLEYPIQEVKEKVRKLRSEAYKQNKIIIFQG